MAGLIALALALVLRPAPATPGTARHGDPRLAATVSEALDGGTGYRAVSAALVEGDTVRVAALGSLGGGRPATARTPFELGSVTKALTGMLMADQIAARRVVLTAPLSDSLPALRGESAGRTTLAELAAHRSGLPRLPSGGAAGLVRRTTSPLTGGDPYGEVSTTALVELAAKAEVAADPSYAYSNLGAALAGQAVAARARTTYPALLRERILTPLGMRDTRVALDSEALPPERAHPTRSGGRTVDPWTSPGYVPAGIGTWSTAEDLGRLARGLLDGSAPGARAMEPRTAGGDPGERVGLFWQVERRAGRTLTWHNGATGGSRAFVGLDRERGRAIVLLATSSSSLDAAGMKLLDAGSVASSPTRGLVGPLLTLAFCVIAAAGLLGAALKRNGADRLGVAYATVTATVTLGLVAVLGTWDRVPSAVWVVAVTAAGVGGGLAAARWPRLPGRVDARPQRLLATGLGCVAYGAAAGLVLLSA